jgi:uncharacterized membrane protein YgcG
MKTRNLPKSLLTIAAVTVTCLFARDVMAQGSSDVATIPNVAPTAAPVGGAMVQLSYGVSQIIQLSKAKVSDNTIVNYIQNSGSSYGLDASQIVYLKQQGISDPVINAMLNQPRPVAPAAPQTAYSTASSTATVVAQPAVNYVQTAPAYVPSSTVYVIPDTQTYQYYNNYYQPAYGYYPYYGGWYYPPVSFSFGFGGGYRGGYYHGGGDGGYRGGYHGGSGYHGGGYRGGGGWHR